MMAAITIAGALRGARPIKFGTLGVGFVLASIFCRVFEAKMVSKYSESAREQGLPALKSVPLKVRLRWAEALFLGVGIICLVVAFA